MLQPPPAQPGMSEEDVDTPALVLDLDAFEHNLATMAALLEPTGVRLRPHAKAHKSPVIAHLQIARGAVGQCVQKVAEAEALAWSGVPDILVSNQIVGAAKLARLASLARLARVSLCADHPRQVEAIENAAAAAGIRLPVLVEVEVGSGRCGAAPGEETAALAQRIAGSRHLIFEGLQAYHSGAQHKPVFAERRAAAEAGAALIADTIGHLARRGLACPTVTGSGTGTFALDAGSGVYTEIQAGSYLFMDADYGRNLDADGAPDTTFRNALFVLATVISTPERGRAVLDAGHKAVPTDSGLPLIWQRPGLRYAEANDEHGKMEAPPPHRVSIGEKLRLVPGHCDPTVDRYDWYVGVRGGWVECVWPVAARGGMY